MKAVKWYAPRDMRLVDADKPTPKSNEALLRIESVGVCGSDLHYYLDGRIGSAVIKTPLVLGHEFGGIVEEVGSEADRSLIGKRVAVEPGIPCMKCEWCIKGHYNVCLNMRFPGGPPHDGAFCEYYCVHAGFCYPVPESISAADSAMIEPLAVAIHTIELAHLKPGETVAILGLGPIGLLVAQVAKFAGAGYVYGTDLHEYRVQAGYKYGVDEAINASKHDQVAEVMRATHKRGVDVVLDCARSSDTMGIACRVAKPTGRCVLTGISGEEEDPLPVGVARRKELTLQWCRRFLYNFPTAIDLAARGKIDIRSLVTHSFPLEKTRDAFELVCANQDGVLKASIDM
jgi:L-iditol 2-dehydrogenase